MPETRDGPQIGIDIRNHVYYNIYQLVAVLEEPSWKSQGRVRVLNEVHPELPCAELTSTQVVVY